MLLDIGLGILSAIFMSNLFGIDLSFTLVFLAIISSLLPDIDTLFHIKQGRSMDSHKAHEHRDLWHYPLLYIPLGTIAIGYFSSSYALLFAITSFLHFVHDSIGVGWGIQWLYPFSRKHYAFFYHYDIFRNNLPKHLIYSWSNKEVEELSEKYGDKNWLRNIYFNWHPYAVVEFLVFVVSLLILYFKVMR